MVFEVISWIGSFILILSYFLLSMNKIKQDNAIYHSMNFVGSTLFIIYSISINANASIFINTIFAIIAIYSVIRIIKSK